MNDLERALAADLPVGAPPVLSGGDVRYREVELPVGSMLLATTPDGVLLASTYAVHESADDVLARLARAVSPRVLRGGSGPDHVARELEAYLSGSRRAFDLEVDPVLATPFQRSVLAGLAAVPYGATASYGQLAASIGRPKASRAVGAALGANPLCVVLPCHRVVAGSGALTGYAGGLEAKKFLLELEHRS
ncbi:methylated-DNA--[protein]-cysteine S-methyltransferase [Spongisporangium articulatum]|uniref:Methylated-DNA--[protein]-cysteine S-methyltransferase n=1 Tax=Spongisporangium articulatum TaxID=3362603 RepID=A0ABW8AIA7_9ACTN